MKPLLICALCLFITSSALAQDVASEVDRLFRQASSGEIRFQSLVKPSKDSLIAMADSASKYLLARLNTTDAREKVTLVEIFRGIGKAATPYLVTALKSDNKDQLRTTARCLAEVKDSAAISYLIAVTSNADFTVRGEAITAIGKSGGGESSARLLESALSDSIDIVRKCAVFGLGAAKSPKSLAYLLAALDDESFAVRLCAYDAIASFDSLAYNAVASALADPLSERQRVLLLRLGGQLKIKSTTKLITNSLVDPSPEVRGWAAWSLARLEGKTATSKLKQVAKSESNQFVRSQIQDALELLTTSKSDE